MPFWNNWCFYLLLPQQLFIEVLFCARFGAWGSSLLLLHRRAEHNGKKSQSERKTSLMAFSSCAMTSLVIKCRSPPWNTFFMPPSIVIFSLLCFGSVSTYYQNEIFGRSDLGKGYSHIQLQGLLPGTFYFRNQGWDQSHTERSNVSCFPKCNGK